MNAEEQKTWEWWKDGFLIQKAYGSTKCVGGGQPSYSSSASASGLDQYREDNWDVECSQLKSNVAKEEGYWW